MRRLASFVCILAVLAHISSCSGNKSNRSSCDSYETEYASEEVKDAEKKPLLFYQRLLEQFCQRYYNGCYSGREYHYNSLIADEMDVVQGNWENGHVVSWEMMITGRHSFDGRYRNVNDSPFTAFVNDLGNDSYEVTFAIKRIDIFGDEMGDEEIATRTMSYSE
ncbi:MAG: hypothetical protein IJQ76_07915 [Prevotella sp.]|nr:hypothetical protein [Prevotella sp.]